LILNLNKRLDSHFVQLPVGMSIDGVALQIIDLRQFPPTMAVTPNLTASAGKEILFRLVEDSSRVTFRVKLSNRDGRSFVDMRSTYMNVRGQKPLTRQDVKDAITATTKKIAKDEQELVQKYREMPFRQSQLVSASSARSFPPGRAPALMAIAKKALVNCEKRIKSLETSIPNDRRRLARLTGVKQTVEQLNGRASIHFELVPVQP